VQTARIVLLIALAVVAAAYCWIWATALTRRRQWRVPTPFHLVVGAITDFLDTLGIGSFATTTSLYRPWRVVADEKIPGTLNVGHCLPTLTQALIYIGIIEVEIPTLVLLIVAAVLGSWLGAGFVTRMSRRTIQIGMGIALLAAAVLILLRMPMFFPSGGEALGVDGWLLAIAIVGNFIFGALMTIGIGAYAPIMVMVSLLGMNPKAAFPIMMGSCAFLMPLCSLRFIRADAYDARAALGLTLAGVPAVLVAAWIVKELDLAVVQWIVLVVVIYTAVMMLRSARVERLAKAGSVKPPVIKP
jgi:uncharacterized membrane protein YfcA